MITRANWFRPRPDGLGYMTQCLENIAGIDCTGYVLRCWGLISRRLDVSALSLDGTLVGVQTTDAGRTGGASSLQVRYVPPYALTVGRHEVGVVVTNRVVGQVFQDRFDWRFNVL